MTHRSLNKFTAFPSLFLSLLPFILFLIPGNTYYSTATSESAEHLLQFENKVSMPDNHEAFIRQLVPVIQQENRSIMHDRDRLEKIIYHLQKGRKIRLPEQRWLHMITHKYRGEKDINLRSVPQAEALDYLNELLTRVDIVPVRLAIAQAAIESAWGQSRFCIEGKAYFGIHCYQPGCGLKAKADEEGGFEVKKYTSLSESVKDYLLFLNSKKSMQRFRNARFKYYHGQAEYSIEKLAGSLKGYSAIGHSYQEMINQILKNYIPDNISDI